VNLELEHLAQYILQNGGTYVANKRIPNYIVGDASQYASKVLTI
jgi:hypothetical protein